MFGFPNMFTFPHISFDKCREGGTVPMMHIATYTILGCTIAIALVAVALGLMLQNATKLMHSVITEHVKYSTKLLSRFTAATNIQAEIYCATQEQKTTRNEANRLEQATKSQRTEYLS